MTLFIRGALVCALNVSSWLQAHGFHSPHTASASYFSRFNSVGFSGARLGDVVVVDRGHGRKHVMIYLRHINQGGICLNPSTRKQKWVETDCFRVWRGHFRKVVRP